MTRRIERRPWTRRSGAMAAFGVFLVVDLTLGLVFATTAVALSAGPASAAAEPETSEVTVAWDNPDRDQTDPDFPLFRNLEFTISQTKHLTNQGITITWRGGTQTSEGEFATNYVQMMQCWGDEAPSPETCQFGAPASNLSSLMGTNAATRGLIKGEDPDQVYDDANRVPPPRTNPNLEAYAVPFRSDDGDTTFEASEYFDSSSTNEITAARTGADGGGVAVFETQTSLEAPHLGCGSVEKGASKPAPCWLVIVPRGAHNLDGSPASTDPTGRVTGSALSAGNWANRIEVKLTFDSVQTSCPIGAQEVRTVGSEPVAEAMTSWQARLCDSGTVYGFSQIGDDEARTQLVSGLNGAAHLGFINEPLDAALAGDATLAYAPAATNAVGIAFNIDYNLSQNSPVFGKNGSLVTELTLNPRLVAKLITQSYKADVPDGNNRKYLAKNPRSILQDPEFIQLNPEFAHFTQASEPQGLMEPLGSSDTNRLLWEWIQTDPDAAAFLRGEPDEWGTIVNKYYLDLKLADDQLVNAFPKADLSTYQQYEYIPEPGYGTLDLRPYTNDFHDTALRARRADAGSRVIWDETRVPPSFISSGPQVPGNRFALGVTDSASAARYGLPMARLVNAGGKAVAPTLESMTDAVELMAPTDVEGVFVTDPNVRSNTAYPLTVTSYAVIDLCGASVDDLKSYDTLLEYIGGAGQTLGDSLGALPIGYAPLTKSQQQVLKDARTSIRKEVASPECESHIETEPTKTTETTTPTTPTTTTTPTPTAPPTQTTTPAPTSTIAPIPPDPAADRDAGATRYAFLASLLLGAPALVSGPLLLRRG